MITYAPTPTGGEGHRPERGNDTVARMADAMLVIAFSGGTVDEAALGLEGFSRAEIAEHSAAARELATARAIHQVRQ